MNADLFNRIYNDKYRSATSYAKDEPEPVKELIGALAKVLGNIGWFDEREEIEEEIRWDEVEVKDLKIILKHALENIGYYGGKK
jgi:hypothetical protein